MSRTMPTIRNVVFDIGNVLIRWDSLAIVSAAFGLSGEEARARRHALFVESDLWRALNRGEMTEVEAQQAYVDAGLLDPAEAERMFAEVYASLHLLPDTPPLMERLADSGYRLFALTDNVTEVVRYLSKTHAWWSKFEGVTVSADVGCLKPDPRIYRHVIDTNAILPEETVFFDDVDINVKGATKMGMHAFVFTDAAHAEIDLRSLGVELK